MIFYEGHKVYMNGEYPAIFLNGKNQHIHRLEWIKMTVGCISYTSKKQNLINSQVRRLIVLSSTMM